MKIFYRSLLLLAPIVFPLAAQSYFTPSKAPCLTLGAATYQLLPNSPSPDYRVKIERAAAHPDLRMQMVERPDIADLVITDEEDAQDGVCAAPAVKSIRVDAHEARPDVVVGMADDGQAADYRIYVHSSRFSPDDAAAMMAAMWKAGQKRAFAETR